MKQINFAFMWPALIVLGLAFGFRSYFQNYLKIDPIATDTAFYDASAIMLVRQMGFSVRRGDLIQPVYFQTPLYSVFLSLIYRFYPIDEPASPMAARIRGGLGFQAVLLAMSLMLYVDIARKLADKQKLARWFVIICLGFYYPFAWYSLMILPEILSLWWIAVFLWLVVKLNLFKWYWQFWLGIWGGLLLLIKPYFIYLPVTYGFWYFKYLKYKSNRLRGTGFFLLGVTLVVIGWIIRTYLVSGHLVVLQAGFQYVTSTSTINPTVTQSVPTVTPKNYLGELVFWHTIHKWREMLTETGISGLKGWVWWLGQLIQITVMAMVGLILLRFNRLNSQQILLVGIFVGALVTHAYLWSLPRYFTALMPLAMILAASGWKYLPKRRLIYLVIGLVFYGLAVYPVATKLAYNAKSVASMAVAVGIYALMWRSLREQPIMVKASLVTLVWLLGIAIWPGVMVLVNKNIEWAYMPLPFVFSGPSGNLH